MLLSASPHVTKQRKKATTYTDREVLEMFVKADGLSDPRSRTKSEEESASDFYRPEDIESRGTGPEHEWRRLSCPPSGCLARIFGDREEPSGFLSVPKVSRLKRRASAIRHRDRKTLSGKADQRKTPGGTPSVNPPVAEIRTEPNKGWVRNKFPK